MHPLSYPNADVLQPLIGNLRPLDQHFAQFIQRKNPTNCPILLLVAALTSYGFDQGHVCLPLKRMGQWYQKLAQDEAVPAIMSALHPEILAATLAQHPMIGTPEGRVQPLMLDDARLYLYRCWRDERDVAAGLLHRPAEVVLAATQIRPLVDKLFAHNTATINQQKIACALAAMQHFTLITGGPGTGKTTTVAALLALLIEAEHIAPHRIALSAPTGKAAARLRLALHGSIAQLPCTEAIKARLPTDVVTVHRLLGAQAERATFTYHKAHVLHYDMVIIDEASMMDCNMMAAVLNALPTAARLVLLGDAHQLASVGAGSMLADICAEHPVAYDTAMRTQLAAATGYAEADLPCTPKPWGLTSHRVHLDKVWRFAAQSPIGQLAKCIHQGDEHGAQQVVDGFPDVLSTQDAPLEVIIQQAAHHYQHLLQTITEQSPITDPHVIQQLFAQCSQYQLLAVVRMGARGVVGLNRVIESQLFNSRQSPLWYEGRRVIINRNLFHLNLVNGDTGLTLSDPQGRLRVWFMGTNGQPVAFFPSQLTHCESAYAITVHRSQGSEFEHMALVLPSEENPLLGRELLYTAVTRAKERVTLYGSPSIIQATIRRTFTRYSGLQARLMGAS